MAEGAGLDVPITGVTVFKEGARVQRGGVVNLEPGLWPVVIGNLPATVDPDSGRIAARAGSCPVNARYTVATAPIPFAGKPGGCVRRSKGGATLSRRLTMRTRHRPQLGGTDRRQNWLLRGAVWT